MFCKHCGKTIDDDSAFCPYCGYNLSGTLHGDTEKNGTVTVPGQDETATRSATKPDVQPTRDAAGTPTIINNYYNQPPTQKNKKYAKTSLSFGLAGIAFFFAGIFASIIIPVGIAIFSVGIAISAIGFVLSILAMVHHRHSDETTSLAMAIASLILNSVDIILLASFLSSCVQVLNSCMG